MFRYEVLIDGVWLPYTAETADMLGTDPADDIEDVRDEWLGEHDLIDSDLDPAERARNELTRALGPIAGLHPDLQGLRVLVWEGRTTGGEPHVVLRATAADLSTGRLRRAADRVRWAQNQLQEARDRLRAETLNTSVRRHLGRNEIAREIDQAWSRRLVLSYLAGYDLITDVRNALPPDWPRRDGWEDDQHSNHFEPWRERLGPFLCGDVVLHLATSGQVQLGVATLSLPSGLEDLDPWSDPDPEQIREHERAGRRHRLAIAEDVYAALHTRVRLLTDEGAPADVHDLATGTVTVERPSRPQRHYNHPSHHQGLPPGTHGEPVERSSEKSSEANTNPGVQPAGSST